ncbi:protoporphyrinogen oxidase [Gryllotalpicola protaetiae]|uniref:Coproporphyrinogen III oxidase n=1 Tax=Gryllotalpicola protaetiae TaxID=2419771 RepID=A0A387BRH7_9MICO|nr:protoporphyrinogen oxidase [Gryllotalpicola protaetiae]AYG03669.1 protoporphyrinogen oxidase [Gryllotalpicola protaetiae]
MSDDALSHLINDEPTRVVVIGGGMGGLAAARDLARPGFEVTLLEASDRLGGSVQRLDLTLADGEQLTVDAGAESFATRGGHVAAYLDELHLGDQVVQPNAAGAWLQLPGRAVPTPKGGLLGIPSVPLATDVIEAIGWGGALRAYLDRLIPPLKIGQERNLGRLVERRMGRAVLENLVAPVTTGVYSASPDQLDVAVVAPGLNQALTRRGSLSGAVTEVRAGGPSKAGSAVGGITGGMWRLPYTVITDARRRGADLRTGARVVGLELRDDAYLVHIAGDDEPIVADAVLVDVPSAEALPLLASVSPEIDALAHAGWPSATSVELVTLVVDAPALDSAPRGTGLLVSDRVDPAMVSAKALTHLTAKWAWVAEHLPAGRHVLRLSYGRAGTENESVAMSDAALKARATSDAAALTNIPLSESDVVGFARVQWQNAQPLAAVGQRDRLASLAAAIEKVPGLEVTGSWVAGTGLASVIPHAREAAARIRGLRWRKLTDADG